jgi:hypothetical protein
MRFIIDKWSIQKLLSLRAKKLLNLNPSYQRNDIWTEKAQMDLISSIKNGMPIPNFFLHRKKDEIFDVADGQQRTRAIIAYSIGEITDLNGRKFENEEQFLDYEIPIVVINEDVSEEDIRSFYVKVNNTGLRLNKPELTKAKYFNTNILKLVEDLCELESFKSLGIFSEKQEDRMIDREFVEELVALIKYGISDKKNMIKRLYEENDNITGDEIASITIAFDHVLRIFSALNNSYKFQETRYSQKNDFYTFFGFVYNNLGLKQSSFDKFFSLLLKIQGDISPSNEKCEPLQFYAYRCVSQSNSKAAREDRLTFFNELLLNDKKKPNKLQKILIKFYSLNATDIIEVENYLTLNPDNIKTKFEGE